MRKSLPIERGQLRTLKNSFRPQSGSAVNAHAAPVLQRNWLTQVQRLLKGYRSKCRRGVTVTKEGPGSRR
jgi:hypothetical protein